MLRHVALIGAGASRIDAITPGVSYKEMTYEAAVRAYADAHITPADIESAVTIAEDFHEGTSIFDEYVPDQLGVVQKPVHTITGDGVSGIIAGMMLIQTGMFDVVVVEGHSKASNIKNREIVDALAMDPIWNRPLEIPPQAIAALEMQRFLYEYGLTPEDCAEVVVKNKAHALKNPFALYGANIGSGDVLSSPYEVEPLHELDIAQPADGAFVLVLASEDWVKRREIEKPVWILGCGYAGDSPSLETRSWVSAEGIRIAGERAYKQAGVMDPVHELDFVEVDDTYSYKEIQHLMALHILDQGDPIREKFTSTFTRHGELPVNPSGGSLGMGHFLDATGLARVYHALLQLRGEAGPAQIDGASTCLVQTWRGVPTTFGAVMILSNHLEGIF